MESEDIRLVSGFSPHPIVGRVNKHLLKVAIAHLLRNALEATPAQGEIRVTTAVDRPHQAGDSRIPAGGCPQKC